MTCDNFAIFIVIIFLSFLFTFLLRPMEYGIIGKFFFFFQVTNNDDSIPFWIEMKFVGLLAKLVLYFVAIWHVNTIIVSFCSNKVVLIRISWRSVDKLLSFLWIDFFYS